jgi:multimeric flavodoxin WrbA
MKLLAINGSPRKKHNTAQLLENVVNGARSAGAEAELVHLVDLKYTGCISCFNCKRIDGKHYGRCAVRDDLTEVLDKAHVADAIVLGSPFYFSIESSFMRACMERLWFQYYLYTDKRPPLSPRKKAVSLVYTMNIKEADIPAYGKDSVIATAKRVMENLFAPCEVFLCTDTLQFDDYSKYESDIFDVAAKLKRHAEVFPQDLQRAYAMGARMAKD